MIGSLALIGYGLWLVWVFYHDRNVRQSESLGIWIVLVWVLIHATRPVSIWLNINTVVSRDEGSPFDAIVDLLLIGAVLWTLGRRRVLWSQVARENGWLFAFYVFWVLSMSWSDDPFVTFKRVFRDFGNVLMVLVVLTEKNPSEAMRAICIRAAYVCVPLSIILYKYFPGIGRMFTGYNHSYMMFVGVTLHKNALGMLVMVAALVLLWDILSRKGQAYPRGGKWGLGPAFLTLLMSWYILTLANSATSLVCTIFGSVLLFVFMSPSFPSVRRRLEVYGVAGAVVVALLNLTFDLKGTFFETVERNETLTTRTDMWPVLIDHQTDVLVGPGFNMFWSGERLSRLPEAYRDFLQAHNGYLETYLNGGIIGLTLLMLVLLSAYWRARKQLAVGAPEWCMKMVIIIVALGHNWAEASFNKVGPLWFMTLFGLMVYSRGGKGNRNAMAHQSSVGSVGAHLAPDDFGDKDIVSVRWR